MPEEKSQQIANLDLDGSLADYDTAMRTALERMRSPSEPEFTQADWREMPAWIEARMEYIKNRPGFWSDLVPIEEGLRICALLRQYNYRLNILTKGPDTTAIAWTEKFLWTKKHIPDAEITITQDKGIVFGRLLFDDWPSYVLSWLRYRPRGLVLMLDQPWNRSFVHQNVVRVPRAAESTQSAWDQIESAIRTVAQRNDGESWQ